MKRECLKYQSMVESFLDDLFETHEVQPRTAKDNKVFLSSIMDQAVKDGIVPYNPVKEVVINKSLADKYAKFTTADKSDSLLYCKIGVSES